MVYASGMQGMDMTKMKPGITVQTYNSTCIINPYERAAIARQGSPESQCVAIPLAEVGGRWCKGGLLGFFAVSVVWGCCCGDVMC